MQIVTFLKKKDNQICKTLITKIPNLIFFFRQGRDLVIYTRTLDSNGTLGDAILGKNLIVNSGFNWKSAINNIALIELTIPLRTIKPISIGYPEGKSTVLSASWTTVTKNWTMETFKKLRFYYLTTVVSSPDGCTSNSEFICTLNKPNDKVCHFDAGAPLIEKSHSGDKLVGVGSHLLTECHGQSGGVFTRVANFIPWIKSVTRVYFRA